MVAQEHVQYTAAEMMTARVAVNAREQCEHEASGRLSGPCAGCDITIVLNTLAPAIAARSIREAAEWLVESMTCADDGTPDKRCEAIREARDELLWYAAEREG